MRKSIQRARFVGARQRAGAGLGAASSGTMIERSVEQNPELWERPLREHLRVKAPLAPMCGSQGCVWLRDDGNVVKITGDFQDFSAALYLEHLGKDAPPQLPRILAVGKLTGDFAGAVRNVGESMLYYIIREDLVDLSTYGRPLDNLLSYVVDAVEHANSVAVGEDAEDEGGVDAAVKEVARAVAEAREVATHRRASREQGFNRGGPEEEGYVRDFSKDLQKLFEWSIGNHVWLEDLNTLNFGVRPAQPAKGRRKAQRARLVLRDFGYIQPPADEDDDYYDPHTVPTLGGLDFDVG